MSSNQVTDVLCDYCGRPAELVTGEVIYPHRGDLWSKKFYYCKPCAAWVGCHRSGKPLGRLADVALRSAKMFAHSKFDFIWKSGDVTRSEAYAWLAEEMGLHPDDCHIGMFDVDQCVKVAELCNKRVVKAKQTQS